MNYLNRHFKVAYALLALVFLSALSVYAQSSYNFDRTDTVSLNAVSKWKNIRGQDATTSSMGVSSNQGYPYNALGNTYYGGIYWDSALVPPVQLRIVLKQLSGTDNVKNFYMGFMNNPSFDTTGGCDLIIQEMASVGDYMYLRKFNQWNPIENGAGSITPTDLPIPASQPLVSNHASGDTFYVKLYADGRRTAIRKRGSTVDSLTSTDTTYDGTGLNSSFNIKSSAYAYLYGRNSTTQILIDDFEITALGAAPASVDTVPPVVASFAASNSSVTTGTAFTLTGTLTDNYSLDYSVIDSSQNGSTWAVWDSVNIAGGTTSYTHTSPSFSRAVVDTVYFRLRVKEDSTRTANAHYDTSSTVTVRISATPTVSQYGKKVYGYVTFTDTRWPGQPSGPPVPADSLPWEALTHIGLFAANGANPPQTSYINQLGPMAARAHQSGVFAGLAVGGSGDAALVTLMANPASWTSWINTYLSYIDTYGIDFIDFDLEGSYTAANVGDFFAVFQDSLDARTSDNDPSRAPFIVLTVGMSRAQSWAADADILANTEFVNIMSYDFIGNWWDRLIHDNSAKSYTNFDGTGVNTDYYALADAANRPAPSYQEAAKRAISGGWPANKVLIGFDANPTYYYSTATTGRGPLYIRQPVSDVAGYADASSDPDFRFEWPTMAGWPDDSIHFDQIAQAYWIHTGTGASTDRVWTFMTMPGKDSGVIATRKVVDSMNIGGVMIWNLGAEIYNTAAVPVGGRGWFFSQLRSHFASVDTIPSTLNPPASFSPANNATGVLTTATFNWEDIAGVNASAGYNIQIDNNSDFGSTIKDTSVTPSQYVLTSSSLANNTTYYARVRVKNAVDVWGGWSSTIAFTTIPAVPGTPTLTSPADAVTGQSQTITFFWQVPGSGGTPTHYQLLVDDESGFNSPHTLLDSTITGLSRQLAGLANSATYYWKVRAKSYAGGWGSYSTARSFTTGSGIPTTPTLLSPSNGATNQNVNPVLIWNRPAGADSFQLQIDSTVDFSTPLKDTLTTNTSYTATLTSGLTYYWRVYSNGASGNSSYSSAFRLTVGTDFQPPAPGSPYRTSITYVPELGIYTSTPQSGIEMLKVPLSELKNPYDTNTVVVGVLGYKEFDGDTVRTDGVGSGSAMTAQQILDSLRTITLDSLYLQSPVIYDNARMRLSGDTNYTQTILPSPGNSSFNTTLPGIPGTVGTKDNTSESYSVGSLETVAPISISGGGTAANLSGQGATGKVVFLESDTMSARAITTTDISGYSTGTILTDATSDTAKARIIMADSAITLRRGGKSVGHFQGSTTLGMVMYSDSTLGVSLYDEAGTGNYLTLSNNRNGAYYRSAGANDVFELQSASVTTTENDSLFQVTDSGATGSGAPVYQVSNKGKTKVTSLVVADTTMATLSADVNNYYIGTKGVVYLSSDATRTITGLLSDVYSGVGADTAITPDGKQLTLINNGENNIILAHQSTASSEKNRIISGGGVPDTIYPNGAVTLLYDGTAKRHRILNNVAGTPGGNAYEGTPDFPRSSVWMFGGGADTYISSGDVNIGIYKDSVDWKRVRTKYPNTLSLHTTDWWVGIPFWSGLVADSGNVPPAWRVRKSTGEYLKGYGTTYQFIFDITEYCDDTSMFGAASEKYQAALATRLWNITNWNTWDGVLSDGLPDQSPMGGLTDIDLDRNGLNDLSEGGKGSAWVNEKWKQGWLVFIDSMRGKFNTAFGDPYAKIIGYHSLTDTLGMTGQNGNSFNGTGWEHPFKDRSPITWDNYIALIKQRDAAGPSDRRDINWVEASPTVDTGRTGAGATKTNNRFARWMILTGQMADVYVGMEDHLTGHYANYRYDEHEVPLGYPTGASDTLASGPWVRFFEDGVIISNTENAERTVSDDSIDGLPGYNGPYYYIYGAQDTVWNPGGQWTTTTFPADTFKRVGQDGYQWLGDAIVLTRTQDTVITDIIIDNSYAATSPGQTKAWWTTTDGSGFKHDYTANEDGDNPSYYVGKYNAGHSTTDSLWVHQIFDSLGSAATATDSVIYRPTIHRAGQYAVYEWHGFAGAASAQFTEVTDAEHKIISLDGETIVNVNQQINYGQWNRLGTGTYTFDIGTSGEVRITNKSAVAGRCVVADAIKFVYMGPPN